MALHDPRTELAADAAEWLVNLTEPEYRSKRRHYDELTVGRGAQSGDVDYRAADAWLIDQYNNRPAQS